MQDIHFVMNKYENMQRKKKCLTGIKNKLEKGICTFRPPIGQTKVKEITNDKETTKINIKKEGESIRKRLLNGKPMIIQDSVQDIVNGIVTSNKYAYKHERINDKYPLKRPVFCAVCGES